MPATRIFTTKPGALQRPFAFSSSPEIVNVERLDVPPPGLGPVSEEYPPVWVGVADLGGLSDRLLQGPSAGRVSFALDGSELLAEPQLGRAVDELHGRGYDVDIVVYLGGYGGTH